MLTETLLIELMNEVGKAKHAAPTGDLKRYYAVMFTNLEKVYAFYLTYLYAHEADIPPASEIQ